DFDLVVIARGGGSDTDFKPFDDFEVAKTIALFPIPVFTGIGHDRNNSIADMMARRFKTPTKVASAIIDHNFRFENAVLQLQQRLEEAIDTRITGKKQILAQFSDRLQWKVPQILKQRQQNLSFYGQRLQQQSKHSVSNWRLRLEGMQVQLQQSVPRFIKQKQDDLQLHQRLVHQLSPDTTLQRGFAMLQQEDIIITSVKKINPALPLKALMADGSVDSTIINTDIYEPPQL
ncbi:MAG TPA: exodeoxyribonuclease VII large subunit, partial [Gammaproteobacteria bacterium]|nr:exodeoxyribonuclease VII large subunit [Gammaproteobacteria bacterium]